MRVTSLLIIAAMLSGCARTPPVSVNYFLPQSSLQARVVRTIGCDASNLPVIANSVTATVQHTANPNELRTTELWRVDGMLSNSELKTDFYGDGRLKAVNATTTGQGETVFKTAIKIAELALEGGKPADRKKVEAACQEFKKTFADKVLTLTFEARSDFSEVEQSFRMQPEPNSKSNHDRFRILAGDTCLLVGKVPESVGAPISYVEKSLTTIKARQPALIQTAVTAGPAGNCAAATLWSALVQVSQKGKEYEIPIPQAALFGKQVFAASFDEAGALTQIQYNKDSGAAQLLNVGEAAGNALQVTDAERAASLKAEADLIAAQQRLVKCQTTPASC